MSSESEEIDCNKTVASTDASKCNRFIYDVTLDISYVADAKWNYDWLLWQTIMTTITCQIGHKYKNWKKCSCVIAGRLCSEFARLNLSLNEWKGTISITGQYVDEDSVNGYSEIIYDWFSYDGFMTMPKNSKDQHKTPPVCLQYTIRFLLNPALSVAQYIYCTKGYRKLIHYWIRDEISKYENIMNTEVDHEKEYNHLEIWQAACNAFKPPPAIKPSRRF
ncbi:hypothetical protein PV325_007626 [Microctonus aethiopoides]|nr:hypothetical protein PV325_007626 [Microctonus aethiopoides]